MTGEGQAVLWKPTAEITRDISTRAVCRHMGGFFSEVGPPRHNSHPHKLDILTSGAREDVVGR